MANPTLGELLLRYGGMPEVALRNLPADAKRTLKDAIAYAKTIPDQAKEVGDTALGALQYARELSPAAYRGRAPAFDKTNVDVLRTEIPELAQLAQETALGGVQNVRNLSPRQLRGSAPRFDTTVADAVGNALVQGVRNLPEAIAERPFKTLVSGAGLVNPASVVPSLLRAGAMAGGALEGAGALASRGLNAMDLGRAPATVNRLYNPSLMGPEFKVGDPNIPAYAYRKMSSPAELDDLIASGFLRPKPGRTNKYFQTSNDPMPAAGMIGGGQPYVRVETRNVPEGKAVRRKDIKIWDDATGSWKSVPKRVRN
jgi:hypothetical protein